MRPIEEDEQKEVIKTAKDIKELVVWSRIVSQVVWLSWPVGQHGAKIQATGLRTWLRDRDLIIECFCGATSNEYRSCRNNVLINGIVNITDVYNSTTNIFKFDFPRAKSGRRPDMAVIRLGFPPDAVREFLPHFPGYFGEHAPGTKQLDGGGGLYGLYKDWSPHRHGGFSSLPRALASSRLLPGPSISAPAASSKTTIRAPSVHRRSNAAGHRMSSPPRRQVGFTVLSVPAAHFTTPGSSSTLVRTLSGAPRLPATPTVSTPTASSAIHGPPGLDRALSAFAHAAPGLSDQHVREREAKILQALAGGGGISDHSLGMLSGRCRCCKNHFLPSRLAEHELACRVILLD
ncbi:hypothetical protein K438DRAFT_2101889 [Mycena galopus ATCC 62051]|nr:hypothetical protein K438DRAFT_2101889 [Mycena galopus ATCC 62051]